MRQEGDTVSGMTDDVSSSSYMRWDDDKAGSSDYGNIIPQEHRFKRGSSYSEVLGYIVRH